MQVSFIKVSADSHFPIQNIPYGAFCRKVDGKVSIGTRIGNYVLDLSILSEMGYFNDLKFNRTKPFENKTLNNFMSLGKDCWHEARIAIQDLLSEDNPKLRDNLEVREKVLLEIENVSLRMPVDIGDYTDFYSSRQHATNVGIMFRGKENALMPNWLHLPVAYHGRASSVIMSDTDIHRPCGQVKANDNTQPEFRASGLLDFELEVGFFIGTGNALGNPIRIEEAENHIFGLVLVNDWSARDIQKWEYVPLGPFLAKNFATSISPWIVTLEALQPFAMSGVFQEPQPLSYLNSGRNKTYDIKLELAIQSARMDSPQVICKSNFSHLYWSMEQQLAHHTVNGCNMRPGDLLASGTISGDSDDSRGSMLELTWRGDNPIKLSSGEERKFLADFDTVIINGYCQGDGYRVGFGELKNKILPAKL